jgi:protein archease
MGDDELFREFEHTGDLGIDVTAPTRAELYARATTALGRLMVEPGGIEIRARRVIEAGSQTGASSDADLMHDLLSAALNVFLADGFIWRDAAVTEVGALLEAELAGERYDPRRHVFLTEIKAVTYHALAVEQAGAQWRARIVFDV